MSLSSEPAPDHQRSLDTRRRRARFRAWHRGSREADLLLGPFVDAWVERLKDDELSTLEALLDEDDHDIWDWVLARSPLPPHFEHPVLDKLIAMATRET